MVLLQLGRSDCLHEHIPSLRLSCLTQSVPLSTMLPGDRLRLGWPKQVSVTCHTFAVWGKSNNLAGGGKTEAEIPQVAQAPRVQTDHITLQIALFFVSPSLL